MRLSFKIEVDDYPGAAEGVPALLNLFDQYHIEATFFFNTGYDNSGLNIRNLFRPAILSSQLPLKSRFYGTFLPPVNIPRKTRAIMKSCQEAGHDIGLRSFDAVSWNLHAIDASRQWTETRLDHAIETFVDIFGVAPEMHSAANYQVNPHLFELEQERGFLFASDTRGKTVFLPAYQQSVESTVMQIPVTLPAIENLLQQEEISLDNVHEYLFVESQSHVPNGHVYAVRAAYEGRAWLPVLEKLIVMWRSSQWEFNRMKEVYEAMHKDELLRHRIGWERLPGRADYFATQSVPLEDEQ